MTTSDKVATEAGEHLRNPKTPKKYRPEEASALSQAKKKRGKKKKLSKQK
jgi:hypothetical protein